MSGFEVAKNNGERVLTHLQYADDTLIFCGADEQQLRYLRVILVLFEGISQVCTLTGRRVTFIPSTMSKTLSSWPQFWEEKLEPYPLSIYGCHWGPNQDPRESGTMFLKAVKAQYLSPGEGGGCFNLINAILDALPTCMLTLFPIQYG